MPWWWLREQNPLLRVEAVTVAEGNGVRVGVVMVTATYLIPAAAQKTPKSRLVVVIVRAKVPGVAWILRQTPSVVERQYLTELEVRSTLNWSALRGQRAETGGREDEAVIG